MGVLKVKVNGAWEDVSGVTTHEVVVSDTDPRQGVYTNAVIWFDTTLPAGERMKVWDPDTSAWVTAEGGGDFLPLAGGTVTGNINFSGTNLGVNFSGGGGVYAHTDKPLTLRRGTSNARPQIRNNDGSNAVDILVNSASNNNVSYQSGWSGTMDFRVNDAMVAVRMDGVTRNTSSGGNAAHKVCGYPTGVPAPWGTLTVYTRGRQDGYAQVTSARLWIEARSDGIYVIPEAYDTMQVGQRIHCTMSWPR